MSSLPRRTVARVEGKKENKEEILWFFGHGTREREKGIEKRGKDSTLLRRARGTGGRRVKGLGRKKGVGAPPTLSTASRRRGVVGSFSITVQQEEKEESTSRKRRLQPPHRKKSKPIYDPFVRKGERGSRRKEGKGRIPTALAEGERR